MKRMKKLFALLMTLAMVMGLGITGFAADNIVGNYDDVGMITVSGIVAEEDNTDLKVVAYPIIQASYNEINHNFEGYSSNYPSIITETVMADPVENIDQDILNSIIAELDTSGTHYEMTESSTDRGTYTAEVPVGSYLVMITGAETKVYNPVVVSVDYQNEEGQNVIGEGDVSVVGDGNAWVKVSNVPKVEKVIDDGSSDGLKGDSANIGDIINYDVTIDSIPNYGGEHPVLNVVDTLSNGLEYVANSLTVKIDGDKLDAGTDYTFTPSGQSLTVDFVVNGEYTLNEYVGKSVVIEYQAKVTTNAIVNEDGNYNDVDLNYSKDSKVDGDDGLDEDKTYTYTFDIDGDTIVTDKIVTKTGEDENEKALPGAVFGLYTDENATNLYDNEVANVNYGNIISDAEGQLYITGLAEGTYYLKELSAPEGYSVNTHIFKIEIKATYNTNGTLASWTYTIDGTDVRTITVNHEGETTATTNGGGIDIENTKLTALPSTGGMGTTLFTIAGCVIMISAAGLFFATRKKAN